MEKQNKPKLWFSSFTDSWEQRKLSDFGRATGGTSIESEFSENGIYKVISIGSYSEDNIYRDQGIRALDSDKTKDRVLNRGDLTMILNDKTASGNIIGRVLLIEESGVYVYNQRTERIEVDHEKYDSAFIYEMLNAPAIRDKIIKQSQGNTQIYVNWPAVSMTDYYIPRLDEQKKIGEYFLAIDNLVSLHQRKCDQFELVKKAMLQKMFPKEGESVPEIRFTGFTDPWEQRKLGKIGSTYTGLSGKTKEDFGHGEGKFVTYMNVFLNPVADLGRTESVEIDKSQNEVQYGDVFFTTSSETPEEVGMSSVWLENSVNTYLNSFCFGYRPTEDIDPYYLAYMLRSDSIRSKIVYLAQGISRYNISKNKVMEIDIPLPDKEEQKQIGKYFKDLDNFITLHQRKCNELKELKKGLLQQMFI